MSDIDKARQSIEYHLCNAERDYRYAKTLPQKKKYILLYITQLTQKCKR